MLWKWKIHNNSTAEKKKNKRPSSIVSRLRWHMNKRPSSIVIRLRRHNVKTIVDSQQTPMVLMYFYRWCSWLPIFEQNHLFIGYIWNANRYHAFKKKNERYITYNTYSVRNNKYFVVLQTYNDNEQRWGDWFAINIT